MKRRSWFILGTVIAISILGFLGYRYYKGLTGLSSLGHPGKPVVVLAVGLDVNYNIKGEPVEDKKYADAVVVGFLDGKRGRITLIEVPGDVRLPASKEDIGNVALAYLRGGMDLTKMIVKELLGVEIDYTVKMNYDGFVKLIDTVGGIQVEVAEDIRFKDTLGGFKVNIPKGIRRLSGVEALQYVRYITDTGGPIERIGRHQKVMEGLVKEVFSSSNLTRLPRIVEAVLEMVQTDIPLKDALKIAAFLEKVRPDKIEIRAIPIRYGEGGIEVDIERLRKYMAEIY